MWIQLNSTIDNSMDTIDDMVNGGFTFVADVIDSRLDGWVLTYGMPTPGINDLYGAFGCGYFDGETFTNVHGNFQEVLNAFEAKGIASASEVYRTLRHDWQFCVDNGFIVTLHGYEELAD